VASRRSITSIDSHDQIPACVSCQVQVQVRCPPDNVASSLVERYQHARLLTAF
jgi:hypothetical protein